MPKTTITCDAWKCLRCKYIWKGKNKSKPLRCPSCGSCYWDMLKKGEEEIKEDVKENG